MKLALSNTDIVRYSSGEITEQPDLLATEEPLEIKMGYGPLDSRSFETVSVTMRTPGHDKELAIGFLKTERIITGFSEVVSVVHCENVKPSEKGNVIRVELDPGASFDKLSTKRNFYTTSSCGVCGKSSMQAVMSYCKAEFKKNVISPEFIRKLPQRLEEIQKIFNHTGGLHACAFFDSAGNLKIAREDIGRHNAMDKVIGNALMNDVNFEGSTMFLSGRVGFELVQKAISVGVNAIVAIGAPSSLAVSMAQEADLILVGFLRGEKFNVYSGKDRVI